MAKELGTRESEDGFHASIFTLESKTQNLKISAPAVKVPVRIEGVHLQMEVDTGAAASFMNYTNYARYFKYLQSVTKGLRAFTKKCLRLIFQRIFQF